MTYTDEDIKLALDIGAFVGAICGVIIGMVTMVMIKDIKEIRKQKKH